MRAPPGRRSAGSAGMRGGRAGRSASPSARRLRGWRIHRGRCRQYGARARVDSGGRRPGGRRRGSAGRRRRACGRRACGCRRRPGVQLGGGCCGGAQAGGARAAAGREGGGGRPCSKGAAAIYMAKPTHGSKGGRDSKCVGVTVGPDPRSSEPTHTHRPGRASVDTERAHPPFWPARTHTHTHTHTDSEGPPTGHRDCH